MNLDTQRPLNQRQYLVLVSLAGGNRHGYAIKKEIRRLTDDEVSLGAGSLYRTIRQLADAGLIEETDQRPDPALDDERRVYLAITVAGRAAVEAETSRLQRFVKTTAAVVAGRAGDNDS